MTNTTTPSPSRVWEGWGTGQYVVMPHVSVRSKEYAEHDFQLRPYQHRNSPSASTDASPPAQAAADVVVISFPKTGTTWTQVVCEHLRTYARNGGYHHYDDLTEVQPWLDFAYDCHQNLHTHETYLTLPATNSEEEETTTSRRVVVTPRVFKSHQLLSAINPGGKYLTIVRDPAATLLSWFVFQKRKGRPGYREYDNVNEYIQQQGKELFGGTCCFGMNIWEMYLELWSARFDPAVKILIYEGLLLDQDNQYLNHLPIIAQFLGLDLTQHQAGEEDLYRTVATLMSREEMLKHVHKFDDHFITEQGKKYGRAARIMEPAAKVTVGTEDGRVELTDSTIEWLEDQWFERMSDPTGCATYAEFATALSELLFSNSSSRPGSSSSSSSSSTTTVGKDATTSSSSTTTTTIPEAAAAGASSATMPTPTPSPRSRHYHSSSNSRKSSISLQQMPGLLRRCRRESLSPDE